MLMCFDKIYDKLNAKEKRDLIQSMVEEVQLYTQEERQDRDNYVKSITYSFPVSDKVLTGLRDKCVHVETVCLLSHKSPDSVINVTVEFGEGEGKVPLDAIAERAKKYQPKPKITYKMIQEYVEKKYGFKVHTAYIAEVKRSLGLTMYDAPNAVEELKHPRKRPPKEKVEAITDALKYFEVI